MDPEIPIPESEEHKLHMPLTPDMQVALDGLEKQFGPYDPSAQPIDDKKRPPFPEEDEWGVPGAEGNI